MMPKVFSAVFSGDPPPSATGGSRKLMPLTMSLTLTCQIGLACRASKFTTVTIVNRATMVVEND